ncbi:hypothetical protein Tco_0706815 [Tanacetum coccineum]|uniref:DUF4216 domain-containing protein n=1 Tax=Tanacetum coccineum TaxID=301880 RepID=A0ABQ4Y8G4_9ASTR
MKEEFPGWFGSQIHQCYIDKDPGVSASGELFALAYGPTPSPISVNSCVVNGVRFVVHTHDERWTTQNNGICSSGKKDGEMYYGQLEEILEFSYMSFKVVLFRVKWFDTSNEGLKIKRFVIRNNITQIWAHGESFKDDQYILATQVKQVFYLEDMARRPLDWKVVQDVNHKKFLNGGVIMVEDDHDVIHFNNSSYLALSTSLDDLDFAILNIDGQSIDVDAPPDIIDVDKDYDLIDDKDALPRDLAGSDDEYLANDDDDDVVMSVDVARGHDGDSGVDDRPPPRKIPTGCRGELENPKGEAGKPADSIPAGKPGTSDRQGVPHKIPLEWKAGVIGNIRSQFDLTPHMQSPLWQKISNGIEQHLAKIYTENKSSLKQEHWVLKPDGTRDVKGIRSRRPANITPTDWDQQIAFWQDSKNATRAAQNARNRAKSKVICRQGSRSLAVLRDTYI